jgi:hypothetical protein
MPVFLSIWVMEGDVMAVWNAELCKQHEMHSSTLKPSVND